MEVSHNRPHFILALVCFWVHTGLSEAGGSPHLTQAHLLLIVPAPPSRTPSPPAQSFWSPCPEPAVTVPTCPGPSSPHSCREGSGRTPLLTVGRDRAGRWHFLPFSLFETDQDHRSGSRGLSAGCYHTCDRKCSHLAPPPTGNRRPTAGTLRQGLAPDTRPFACECEVYAASTQTPRVSPEHPLN